MTTPAFLNTDFAYLQLSGVTDVQTIMDSILTMLTSTLTTGVTGAYPTTQRWSIVSGTTYKSPVDSRGRYMQVSLTRTSITRLRLAFSDPTGLLYDGEIRINGAGSTVNLYAGPGHLLVESNNSSPWEVARMFMSDPTPEALDSGPSFVWALGHRDVNGNATGQATIPEWWSGRFIDGSLPAGNPTQPRQVGARPFMPGSDDTNTHTQTEAGSDVAVPVGIGCPTSNALLNTSNFHCGKLYQAIWVDSSQAVGAVIAVPIDVGVLGNFKVTGLDIAGGVRLAVRVT